MAQSESGNLCMKSQLVQTQLLDLINHCFLSWCFKPSTTTLTKSMEPSLYSGNVSSRSGNLKCLPCVGVTFVHSVLLNGNDLDLLFKQIHRPFCHSYGAPLPGMFSNGPTSQVVDVALTLHTKVSPGGGRMCGPLLCC